MHIKYMYFCDIFQALINSLVCSSSTPVFPFYLRVSVCTWSVLITYLCLSVCVCLLPVCLCQSLPLYLYLSDSVLPVCLPACLCLSIPVACCSAFFSLSVVTEWRTA